MSKWQQLNKDAAASGKGQISLKEFAPEEAARLAAAHAGIPAPKPAKNPAPTPEETALALQPPKPLDLPPLELAPREGVASQFLELFAEFDKALIERSPNLPIYLEKLRADLQLMPDLPWKLKPEEIGRVVQGMMIISRVTIANAETATKGSKKKSDMANLMMQMGVTEGAQGAAALKAKVETVQDLDSFMGMLTGNGNG